MAFILRNYQRDAVKATIEHFRKSDESAVIVLPTGAGKSLVIAELARLAKRKILVLAHVKELVEQNHAKYESYGLTASIYSAGLKQKSTAQQVTFASIQSVARNLDAFSESYSLVIIDECHRVSGEVDENLKHSSSGDTQKDTSVNESQYLQLTRKLKSHNPGLKVLGLTATPYRMGIGWIYRYHYHGYTRADDTRPFSHCIYELPLNYMIKNGYLTPPKVVDAAIAHYDFSSLNANSNGQYNEREVNELLARYPRVTQGIIEQIKMLANGEPSRQGVMIFAASINHAKEITGYLNAKETALITGDTPPNQRTELISRFKSRELKFLVNVAVLTTGFDAPHVDMIAILRPTESVSLYQQIVGRGLRLSDGKTDCLVVDYAGNGFDLFYPEVGAAKPSSESVPVMVHCPKCEFANTFWGITDDQGQLIEHYGRKCWGYELIESGERVSCDYRFRFKECRLCGAENDIAARQCARCHEAIIDPDDQLKAALRLKNAMVIRCAGVTFEESKGRLKIIYHDEQGVELSEHFDLSHKGHCHIFNQYFGRRFKRGTVPKKFTAIAQVIESADAFTAPDYVIARKVTGKARADIWRVKERIFDYQGAYRKANEM
ncbi:DEAD/DEAH box helicase [Alkalimarinus sediminis]|uniref:DEAD/DEAH box helicase n=1 Tax=Alkalimarinus sediminis TaxID=1632866 RepID=A0A9E8KMN8_9ALTE|nr:DEAD/DEAH box helicase [Alkalimarinus sediminis]UZW73613.1 DEAD/DEAH box helicase [Alkalimarinus sediminis]